MVVFTILIHIDSDCIGHPWILSVWKIKSNEQCLMISSTLWCILLPFFVCEFVVTFLYSLQVQVLSENYTLHFINNNVSPQDSGFSHLWTDRKTNISLHIVNNIFYLNISAKNSWPWIPINMLTLKTSKKHFNPQVLSTLRRLMEWIPKDSEKWFWGFSRMLKFKANPPFVCPNKE